MILLLSVRFAKPVSVFFFVIFSWSTWSYAEISPDRYYTYKTDISGDRSFRQELNMLSAKDALSSKFNSASVDYHKDDLTRKPELITNDLQQSPVIGGPTQPEVSSFKSAGVDNMVDLFTGDFSYNIPLMDVGGYPINIFYNAGIGPEQEASWVGLGWNLNPGTVTRNVRGIPDDFNGQDQMVQKQASKPNITWGFQTSGDLEFAGIKGIKPSTGYSFGVSFNNYLGPALEVGLKNGLSIAIGGKAGSEKQPFKAGAGVATTLSSRNGLTVSPNMSLSAHAFDKDKKYSFGAGISTSYNSKEGVKALQVYGQASFNRSAVVKGKEYSSTRTVPIYNSTISFARPSYIPTLRMPLSNQAISGHFQVGTGNSTLYGSGEFELYKHTSEVIGSNKTLTKPMVGYLYYQNIHADQNAVMDFSRVNDNEVTPNTPVISAPQYTYDVFSIQGEGTGGTIRLYRADQGYVRDNLTRSEDRSNSGGVDIGIPGHYGANFNRINTPTQFGPWEVGNKLKHLHAFKENIEATENVYFRNPGETTVLLDNEYDHIAGTDLVRLELGGTDASPTIENGLRRFSKENKDLGTLNYSTHNPVARKKRKQVSTFLTAEEASKFGLDLKIHSYSTADLLDQQNRIKSQLIDRFSGTGYRKSHHISQISVLEGSGRTYVYGIPVYNLSQTDYAFSVNTVGPNSDNQVMFSSDEADLQSSHLQKSSDIDGMVQVTTTPPYAHSYLLTGLLSGDYVDITQDGITEDDIGDAVKFNYTKIGANYKWKTPSSKTSFTGEFNAGNNTDPKDNKVLVSTGERESWYLQSIESKTYIAIFTLLNRDDANGLSQGSDFGANSSSDESQKKLHKIDLYSKADLKANGLSVAKPIKTVWFHYSHTLCEGTPDNLLGTGKLTLDSINFSFNGKPRNIRNTYIFQYVNSPSELDKGNPSYSTHSSDRWGTYKHHSGNPADLLNKDYPYSRQGKLSTDNFGTTIDDNAGAWSLKKILLPSGGQIEVEYESDDYAFVQNKRAASMMEIVGLGPNNQSISNRLYTAQGFEAHQNNFLFIKVPIACVDKNDVFKTYLEGNSQLALKIGLNVPKGMEYLRCFISFKDYGVYDASTIWIEMEEVDDLNPISLAAINYIKQQLTDQAFPAYDVSDEAGLNQLKTMFIGMLQEMLMAFSDPLQYFQVAKKLGQTINPGVSFIRLNQPDGFKLGGGHRVKSIRLKDNWSVMTGQYTSVYGKTYDYRMHEDFNGVTRLISSGVASYEPSIGGEENPFQSMLQIKNSLPMGPASYGAIEMPFLDAFFPAPVVGYSRVTVSSIDKSESNPVRKRKSGVGKQVSEFYTAKEFPSIYTYTNIDESSNKEEHDASLLGFFQKYAFDSRAISQGFLVETNDMHGKLKSQSSYAENDPNSRIQYIENFYRNTGSKGLDEKFDFAYALEGGKIRQGNMGIDIELYTDVREFSVKTESLEIQGQVDNIPVAPPAIWLPFIWPVTGYSENTYRAVTVTKVINYHGILDRVVVIDKGSQVSTQNLIYDAESGEVIVSTTQNQYGHQVYNTNYPAWWAYDGMGSAYKNIHAIYRNVNFLNGRITGSTNYNSLLESGDELYILNEGSDPTGCGALLASDPALKHLWVLNLNKNKFALNDPEPDYIFIDRTGRPYTRNGVDFKVIRSGRRNLLSATVSSVISMTLPEVTEAGIRKLNVGTQKIINASAIEYKEKWQTDNDIIKRIVYDTIVASPDGYCYIKEPTESQNCDGEWERTINPYLKGLLGNFRSHQAKVFYGSRVTTAIPTTDITKDGYLEDFQSYWSFVENNLVPNLTNTKWVWNNSITKINSKGQELETKNALGVYTSAQYGYNKTLPLSITQNARYTEMGYSGFEDIGFNQSIRGAQQGCDINHLDMTSMSNSTVVNALNSNFNAHTGNYVLGVNANSVASKVIPIKGPIDSMNLVLLPQTKNGPLQASILDHFNLYSYTSGSPHPSNHAVTLQEDQGAQVGINDNLLETYSLYSNDEQTHIFSYYLLAEESGTYGFSSTIVDHGGSYTLWVREAESPNEIDFSTDNPTFNFIYTHSDEQISGTGQSLVPISFDIDMCGGKYYQIIVKYTPNPVFYQDPSYVPPNPNNYYFSLENYSNVPIYNTLYVDLACDYLKPITGSDSLVNSTFQIPASKKMVFSAWVKENCGDLSNGIPCTKTVYTGNSVEILFNNNTSVVLKPSGPIIEGWQRYEGYFEAPAGASEATLRFINSTNNAIFFDDVRLHPYNGLMKSYVYDNTNLRLVAELDENNYAVYYEYDPEGNLARKKVETRQGIKTLTETRSAKQRGINSIQ